MKLSNELYDVLNQIQRWLNALGIFYLTISAIWHLPFGEEVQKTIVAVAVLLGAFLEVSTVRYKNSLKALED